MTEARVTHIGGPTVLLEVAGWRRLLTDPLMFDPPGRSYRFGWGTGSRKRRGPRSTPPTWEGSTPCCSATITTTNLDPAGRSLLPSAGAIITTVSGAERLGRPARGLEPWQSTTLEAADRPTVKVTATPCRHGPPLSRPLVGDVVGFALDLDGLEHGTLWLSGDTVLYAGVREVAERLDIGTALLHLGGVRFPGDRSAALHDDGPRCGGALRSDPASHGHPDPL